MRLTITLTIMSISSIRLSAIISVRATSVEHLIAQMRNCVPRYYGLIFLKKFSHLAL